jgi:aspartate/methionine/tyrosine aminotransferase
MNSLTTSKIGNYDKMTIWYKATRLAVTTDSANLGQGFPDWKPPTFFLDAIKKFVSSTEVSHQYTRTFGNPKLVEAISNTYSPIFNRKIDPMKEVIVANGAVSILYNTLTALVEPDDEVILIEPFYDCYLPQTKFSGGKVIGVPMIPPKVRPKSEYENMKEEDYSKITEDWKIDMEKLKNAFTSKTKILVLNTPNNPTGKILTYDELKEIASILEKFPNVIVIMDEVYEFMVYDEHQDLPRMANLPGMWDRCLSIMSAGKIFSATGIRIGWALGPKHLISKVGAIYQFNSFCIYDPIQLAIAESLEVAKNPYEGYETYFKWLRGHYTAQRNYMISNLAKNKNFDVNFYFPKGGYFIVADISQQNVPTTKYRLEGDEEGDVNYHKDFNFLLNLAYEKKVVIIPCSVFYTDLNKAYGENFIRLAFCKQKSTLDRAFNNILNN